MARSIVLKDLSNRPSGYIRVSGEDLLCRTTLKTSAQLVVLFEDGSKVQLSLDDGMQEQRFLRTGKQIWGCYVFFEEELLLVSDERMREEFYRYAINKSHRQKDKLEEETDLKTEEQRGEKMMQTVGWAFAQRRWPPPPCWNTASYHLGRWMEEEKRRI